MIIDRQNKPMIVLQPVYEHWKANQPNSDTERCVVWVYAGHDWGDTPCSNFNQYICKTRGDDCDGNLCENGAACLDGVSNYTCSCPPGYTGQYCNIGKCTPKSSL